MRWLKGLFVHDYERDGPGFYEPKQRGLSLIKCMLLFVGVNILVDVLMSEALNREKSSNVYSDPWLLLMWMSVGAIVWWVDKSNYMSWLSKRTESELSVVERAVHEKGVQQ